MVQDAIFLIQGHRRGSELDDEDSWSSYTDWDETDCDDGTSPRDKHVSHTISISLFYKFLTSKEYV